MGHFRGHCCLCSTDRDTEDRQEESLTQDILGKKIKVLTLNYSSGTFHQTRNIRSPSDFNQSR
jgi:hypothetical protein